LSAKHGNLSIILLPCKQEFGGNLRGERKARQVMDFCATDHYTTAILRWENQERT
jgi:hypothetical protein